MYLFSLLADTYESLNRNMSNMEIRFSFVRFLYRWSLHLNQVGQTIWCGRAAWAWLSYNGSRSINSKRKWQAKTDCHSDMHAPFTPASFLSFHHTGTKTVFVWRFIITVLRAPKRESRADLYKTQPKGELLLWLTLPSTVLLSAIEIKFIRLCRTVNAEATFPPAVDNKALQSTAIGWGQHRRYAGRGL